MPELTVAYAGTTLLLRVSSEEQYFCQGKPEHKAFRASEGVKASRIQAFVYRLYIYLASGDGPETKALKSLCLWCMQ